MLKKLTTMMNENDNMYRNYNSTTLLEVLLVITLVMFLAGLSAAILPQFLLSHQVDSATHVTVQAFNNARTYAIAQRHNSDWGVKISSGEIIVFKGDNFDNRDDFYDQVFDFPRRVNMSGENIYVFEKKSGDFEFIQGAEELVFGDYNFEQKIKINEKGIYSY